MNLLYDPWIRTTNRTVISLNQLWTQAATIHDIYALDSQLELGLYRFLAAMVQDAIRPETKEEIGRIKDFNLLPGFFEGMSDLFDMDIFYQVPEETDKIASVARLSPEASTGNNTTHFCHRYDDEYRYCYPCCAHAMIALPANVFGTGGGFYANPVGSVLYWVPVGNNLFETLRMLLIPGITDYDKLWWRRPNVVVQEKKVSVSYLETLTFSPRRIRLIPDGTGICTKCGQWHKESARQMRFGPGYGLEQEVKSALPDPWVARRPDGRQVFASASPFVTPEQKVGSLKLDELTLPPILAGAKRVKVYGMAYENAGCAEMYQTGINNNAEKVD